MAKLDFRESPVSGIVINNIQSSLDHLNDAINVFYSMSIPAGFSERTRMESCKSDFIMTRNQLNDLKAWALSSIRTYRLALDDMNRRASLLPKPSIITKRSFIR